MMYQIDNQWLNGFFAGIAVMTAVALLMMVAQAYFEDHAGKQ